MISRYWALSLRVLAQDALVRIYPCGRARHTWLVPCSRGERKARSVQQEAARDPCRKQQRWHWFFEMFQIVSDGFRLFQMVSDCFRWFQIVSDGFRLFQMVSDCSDDFRLLHPMRNGNTWGLMIVWCSSLIQSAAKNAALDLAILGFCSFDTPWLAIQASDARLRLSFSLSDRFA